MNEKKDFLGKEPVGKLLLRLALRTVTAQIINMLYNIVDRMYIGHIPNIGDAALTGVGVCMPLIMIVSAFSAFAAYGGAPPRFHLHGPGRSRLASFVHISPASSFSNTSCLPTAAARTPSNKLPLYKSRLNSR